MLTAEQAALVSERKTIVIPTKTIPQGMSAALAFDADGELDETERAMREAFEHVKSGSITYAVRDSEVGSLTIHKDDTSV